MTRSTTCGHSTNTHANEPMEVPLGEGDMPVDHNQILQMIELQDQMAPQGFDFDGQGGLVEQGQISYSC